MLPKFTCDVRTKFSDISIFIDVPPKWQDGRNLGKAAISDFCRARRFEFNDGFPPIIVGGSALSDEDNVMNVVVRLLRRVRPLLDFLEPLQVRQYYESVSSLAMVGRYSFSLVRWKSTICFFYPYLKDALDCHESFHPCIQQDFRQRLDDRLASKTDPGMLKIDLLNAWYEGLSTIEDTSMVDIAAKEHLLSSLTHHILHIYHMELPTPSARNELMRPVYMRKAILIYNTFPRSIGLLPATYRCLPDKGSAQRLMQMHDERSTLGTRAIATTKPTSSPKSSEETEYTKGTYIPARLAVIFGLKPDEMLSLEQSAREHLLTVPEPIGVEMLGYSSWTLSLGFRAFMVRYDIERCTDGHKFRILACMTIYSRAVRQLCIDFHHQTGALDKLATFGEMIMTNRSELEDFIIERLASDEFNLAMIEPETFEKHLRKRIAVEGR